MKKLPTFILAAICLAFICTFISCSSSSSQTEPTAAKDSMVIEDCEAIQDTTPLNADLKERIIGIWTDGESENATFQIHPDSIYYVEHLKSYPYSLSKDSIKINYESDFTYSGKISFIKDTLVMTSSEGTLKFWKFEN